MFKHCIIPAPTEFTTMGKGVEITPVSNISWRGPESAGEMACLLARFLRPATGFDLPVSNQSTDTNSTFQLIQKTEDVLDDAGFADESYSISTHENTIVLEATTSHGLARAVQTVRQLLPAEIFSSTPVEQKWEFPGVQINDKPLLRWRGLHLDVSRHFFNADEVCRFIDLMALHKFNTLHMHLTDDQGWRLEINRYPKLTEIGSVRNETLIGHLSKRPRVYDGVPHSGYYTQDEMKSIIEYAAQQRINIVPEIDIPGHVQAVLAAYPELGVNNTPQEVWCQWGICQNILNVEPETVEFICNIFDEVIDLFPSRFIHLGGDEAVKYQWETSSRIQKRMAEVGAADEHELQSWFIRQVSQHICSRGRRVIGWDEILEGGLAKGAAVMSWRGENGAIEAAKIGHDTVLATNAALYFDNAQTGCISEEPIAISPTHVSTLEDVYEYNPICAKIPVDKQHHILGVQGQLWTEYIPNIKSLEYMAYPRACALSEVGWRDRSERKIPDFIARLRKHRQRLDILGVHAHFLP